MRKLGHIILTGERDSGKSTSLWNFFDRYKKKMKISGWISMPAKKGNRKVGYDVVFLKKSSPSKPRRFFRLKPFPASKKWRKFHLDMSVFKEAEKISRLKGSDVFIIDEVGPLELLEKKGFYPLLDELYKNNRSTITVVRPELVQDFVSLLAL